MEPLLGSTPRTAGDLERTPFAHVLVELLETEESGTLFIHGETQELEAAIRIEGGFPTAAQFAVSAEPAPPTHTSNGLLQALIPLCSRRAGAFRFVAGEYIDMEQPRGTARVDVLALMMAASRGPLREDVVELVMISVSRNLVRLNPRVNVERYGLTAQERTIVDGLVEDPIDVGQLRAQCGAPERVVRRVLYVLRVTHALTLLPLVRRAQSGTLTHASPLPDRPATEPAPASSKMASRRAPREARARSSASPAHPSSARPGSARPSSANPTPAKPTVVFTAPRVRPASGPVTTKVRASAQPGAGAGAGSSNPFSSAPPRKSAPATRTLLEAGLGRYSMTSPQGEGGESVAPGNKNRLGSNSGAPGASQRSQRPERPDPEACFARAERLMRQREYAAALQAANEALRLGGDGAEHEALYGYLLCLQGGGAELQVHPRAIAHIDRALRSDPLCERANLYKGMVLKRLGRLDEAHNYFLRAMQVNRENVEAAREVRLYDMRRRNRDSRPSLVDKLFKRFGDK